MGESRDKVIKAIKHYQDSLERHSKTKNSDKLLHAIDRLSSLPIRVWHLEETGVGRTVNGLKRYEGEVGESARNLVDKWKSMVKDEEEEELAKQEKQIEEAQEPVDDDPDEESLQIAEQPEELEEETREKTKEVSSPKVKNGKKRRHSVDKSNDAELSPKKSRRRSTEKCSDTERSSKKSRRHSTEKSSDSDRLPKKSKSSHHREHSKHKQRKKSETEDSDDSDSSEDSTPPRKSHKSKRDSSSDSSSSSSSSSSDRSGDNDSDNDSDSSHSGGKHRKGKTCSKRSKHSRESKHKDTKKADSHRSKEKSSSRSESDRKHKDKSSSRHKDKSDKESSSSKERSKSSSSKHKHTNDKGKSRSSDKEHKKSSSSSESKEKSNKKESEKTSKKSSKVKVQSTGQLVNGIDSGSGASFADALGMLEAPMPLKLKKKKLANVEAKASTSKSVTENSKTNSEVPDLLKAPEELEPLNINDISSLLPSITPNYRPLGLPVDQPRKGWTDEEALSRVISAKHQRTKVYSGNKSSYTKVPTLFDICSRVLQDNLDALEYTGGVPYSILKPILEKANPNQLYQLEFHNPYLIEDTDELWQLHCQKEFRNAKREEMETWRDMYMRCLDEREARLKALTANIKQSQDKSIPVRQTKLAYVDSVVKPPRNIARKQAKNGTAVDIKRPSQTPTERLSQLAKAGEASKVSVPNPGRAAADRSSSSSSHSSSNLKPKKAPLMAKTLSLLKNRFGRR